MTTCWVRVQPPLGKMGSTSQLTELFSPASKHSHQGKRRQPDPPAAAPSPLAPGTGVNATQGCARL